MSKDLLHYTLQLADNVLILGHRNSEWCAHGPVLEQDIAITNISLDLIGQARNFYQYAAELINANDPVNNVAATEDTLAYFRDVRDFKNCLLTEQPNGDWAKTTLRQFFFSAYQFYLFQQLQHSTNARLAAIAEKSLKEVTYHLRWSSEWIIRLGDGTEESHSRMNNAINDLWKYTGEFWVQADYEASLVANSITIEPDLIHNKWDKKITTVFAEATLAVPEKIFMQTGGKQGTHTEQLGYILSDLQFMQRAYPGNTW